MRCFLRTLSPQRYTTSQSGATNNNHITIKTMIINPNGSSPVYTSLARNAPNNSIQNVDQMRFIQPNTANPIVNSCFTGNMRKLLLNTSLWDEGGGYG